MTFQHAELPWSTEQETSGGKKSVKAGIWESCKGILTWNIWFFKNVNSYLLGGYGILSWISDTQKSSSSCTKKLFRIRWSCYSALKCLYGRTIQSSKSLWCQSSRKTTPHFQIVVLFPYYSLRSTLGLNYGLRESFVGSSNLSIIDMGGSNFEIISEQFQKMWCIRQTFSWKRQ